MKGGSVLSQLDFKRNVVIRLTVFKYAEDLHRCCCSIGPMQDIE